MIFDVLRWHRNLIMMDEDGGGGGTADGTSSPEDGNGGDNPETEEAGGSDGAAEQVPGYFSQLPGDKAKSEGYKALYKYQKLDDVTDALLAANKRLDELQSDRTLIVPAKGDKEGAAEFWKKLGVPDNPDDYKLEALKDGPAEFQDVLSAVRKGMQRAKLTQKQAEVVAEMYAKASVALGVKRSITLRENIRNQTEHVAATYADVYTADIDRRKAAEGDVARYESFIKETGLEELINKSSLAGNPQLIRAISSWARKYGGTVTQKGTSLGSGPKPGGKKPMNESEDWKRYKANNGQI